MGLVDKFASGRHIYNAPPTNLFNLRAHQEKLGDEYALITSEYLQQFFMLQRLCLQIYKLVFHPSQDPPNHQSL